MRNLFKIIIKKNWYCLIDADVVSFFAASKGKKPPKIGKNSYNRRNNNSYLLSDLMNFNEIFWKNVTYDDIKKD